MRTNDLPAAVLAALATLSQYMERVAAHVESDPKRAEGEEMACSDVLFDGMSVEALEAFKRVAKGVTALEEIENEALMADIIEEATQAMPNTRN